MDAYARTHKAVTEHVAGASSSGGAATAAATAAQAKPKASPKVRASKPEEPGECKACRGMHRAHTCGRGLPISAALARIESEKAAIVAGGAEGPAAGAAQAGAAQAPSAPTPAAGMAPPLHRHL